MEQAYSGKCIFMTGATGFMGKVYRPHRHGCLSLSVNGC